MTAEQVIQAGRVAEDTGYSSLTHLQFIIIIFLFLVIFFVMHKIGNKAESMRKHNKDRKSMKITMLDTFFPFTLIVPILWSLGLYFYETGVEIERYQDWRDNYAEPYIDSLEPIKIPIADINFTGEDMVTVIYFKDNELVRKSGNFEVKLVDSEDDKIYFEYKELKQDLGRKYVKGLYHEIVYIPKTYRGKVFTE